MGSVPRPSEIRAAMDAVDDLKTQLAEARTTCSSIIAVLAGVDGPWANDTRSLFILAHDRICRGLEDIDRYELNH